MPRPQRCRRVCSMPRSGEFAPAGIACPNTIDTVIMSIDEYEVIRLIDLVGLTQEQCALQINVARTTVTGIYDVARRKIADALVHGKRLLIEGGNIELCKQSGKCCNSCHCRSTQHIKKGD
ncbi:DUF134 domain-containing protein [Megasphaera paucivorans]|uniref:UPF0251 protein SAMN05660299_00381 n=1 Tax=Megasphaera paucivorans TaxID=349095 RepID=A0A1G9R3T2_9FIRM|nr:DUF134 domain-containing protein [Megasphaera paucivorans]SDM17780.1 Predicted DNA-binding protein, UPF0251 family [Megasphaera paucivorans]